LSTTAATFAHEENQSDDDFARVEISTPFNKDWLQAFVENPQRILRINSLFEFSKLEKTGDTQWHMVGKNLSNNVPFDVTFEAKSTASGFLLTYNGWLKTSTKLHITKADDDTCRLIITDDYSGTNSTERKQRIAEVDNSIIQWGNDIHRYLQQWKRWSWLPGWKRYMLGYWQAMKPSTRRISFMLITITMAEFAIFLFVFLIFWLEGKFG
jgi:hypothetical protein